MNDCFPEYFKHFIRILFILSPSAKDLDIHGSGIFIFNPPWTLHDELKQVMPYLVKVLGQDGGAAFELEFKENSAV